MNAWRQAGFVAALAGLAGLAGLILGLGLAGSFGTAGSETATEGRSDPEPATDMQTSGMAGMDMGGDGSVRLSDRDMTTFGITFGTVERRALARAVRAVGLVEFDERRMAYLAPKFGGWAERLHADFTGQVVRAGQPLVDVYAPELITAQEEMLLAARMLDSVQGSRVAEVTAGASELLHAARRRLAYWDVTDAQIERILEAREVSRTLTLFAPVSGVVMEKNVLRGQAFEPGGNLFMIADLSEVWVNAEVFEADVSLVREGMPVEVTVTALPGQTFLGRVEYVYPTLQDRTRSLRARVVLANPRRALRPGMYATVRLEASLGEVLTVPAAAVLRTGERAVAFVDMGDGSLMPHELVLGVSGGSFVQVLSGLEPGQRVVTSAQYLLDSESNLGEVMRAMMAQMNLSDMGAMDMDGTDMSGMDMSGGTNPPQPPGGR